MRHSVIRGKISRRVRGIPFLRCVRQCRVRSVMWVSYGLRRATIILTCSLLRI